MQARSLIFVFSAILFFAVVNTTIKAHVLVNYTTSAPDTTEVKTLVTTAMDLFHAGKLDSSLQLAIKARNIAEKIKYKKGYGNALLASGYAYRLKGSYPAAIKDFNEALLIFAEIKDELNAGRTHNFLAQTYENLGDQQKVIDHLMQARELVEKKGHQAGLAVIYIDIGNYYSNRGNFELALENFLKSLNASTSIRADSKIAVALNNIGLVYERMNDLNKAMDYYNQGLAVATAANVLSKKALLLINIGGLQIVRQEYMAAEKNLHEALQIAESSGDKENLGLAWTKLGDLYYKKGSFQKSEEYFLKTLALAREIRHSDLLMRSLCGISDLHLKARDYASARHSLTEALEIADRLKAKEVQKVAYRSMARVDSAKAAFKDAFAWFQRYVNLNDSLVMQQNAARISFLQSQVASTADNVQLASLPEQTDDVNYLNAAGIRWNNVVVALSLLLALSASLLVFFGVQLKLKNKAFAALNEKLKLKEEAAGEEGFI